jgi:hypothetical protein
MFFTNFLPIDENSPKKNTGAEAALWLGNAKVRYKQAQSALLCPS